MQLHATSLTGLPFLVFWGTLCVAIDPQEWCCMLPDSVRTGYEACSTVNCNPNAVPVTAGPLATVPVGVVSPEVVDAEIAEVTGKRPRAEGEMLSGADIFEGDILGYTPGVELPKDTSKVANNFVRNDDLRWPDGVVPYMISGQFRPMDKKSVRDAMNAFSAKTPITFREKAESDEDFVYIGPAFGCNSYVGRQKGKQVLSLQVPGCMGAGYVQHELMHAIVFFHEQSRTDRDKYVEINWANIRKDQWLQFQSYSNEEITAFGKPYDFGSILHYGMYDFAVNKDTWTIRPKSGRKYDENAAVMGQRRELSQTDIEKIKLAYGKPTDDHTCPISEGWIIFQTFCYYFSFLAETPLKKSFSRARTFCRERNAKISQAPRNKKESFFSSQLSSDAANLDDDEMVYVSNCNTISKSNVKAPEESDCDAVLYFVCSKRISRPSE